MGSTKIPLRINAQHALQVVLRARAEAAQTVFPAQVPIISNPLPANVCQLATQTNTNQQVRTLHASGVTQLVYHVLALQAWNAYRVFQTGL